MRLALALCAVVGGSLHVVKGSAGVFTYYDDTFSPPGSSEVLQVGPANWKALRIPNNQCGGIGQRTGFGQSPVKIPREMADHCVEDLFRYEFEGGDCTFGDMDFEITTNGVVVGPKHGHQCSLGRMKIPGNDNVFNALYVHIHTNSEHSVDGKYYPAELQVVHRDSTGQYSMFSTFIDKHEKHGSLFFENKEDSQNDAMFRTFMDPQEEGNIFYGTSSNVRKDGFHKVFESYLQGWEAVATQTNEFCAMEPEGSGDFTPNRLFTSRQMLLQCPKVGAGVSKEDIANLDYEDETNHDTHMTTRVPKLKTPTFPSGAVPSIYESLPTEEDFGIYTYKGGLTTPPCTESVHWNIIDKPMYISPQQLDRLYTLILCFVERSTCRHATVASTFGGTNRPPQPLNGRIVLYRCPNGPKMALNDPIPPEIEAYEPPETQEPWIAMLYPWFVMALGIIVYYILSRFVHALPYTAVMFILGTFMGIGITLLKKTDQLSTSIRMWDNINAELLLLTFLPGLIYRDAFCLNIYLLKDALFQCIFMAFPMVLAGTALSALVGYYILPYGWSFSLSMTFGAILSATDPVAVSALLNEVGAPPRLKMHISGESLLNDGSAMVFYTIFASMFLYELGIPGLGHDIDTVTGVALFFRMSLGAVAIGLAFGLALVRILHHLHRRFQQEESIVQVTATITVAYLTYYVAEAVCHTSGVLAVVVCGVITKAFGENMINDKVKMEKFWVLVEHLLNTLIFALGGSVWGTDISNSENPFSARDWGYLFLVYILMMVIRFSLFAVSFPLLDRIGLRTSLREVIFISFGGLRGAVGIALAIALESELRHNTVPGDPNRAFTSRLFDLTGGVALLTLLINGTLCGPLLRKLGLADSTKVRKEIVQQYRHSLMQHLLERLLHFLACPLYQKADFAVIQKHVPSLQNVTPDELKLAVKRKRDKTPAYIYERLNLRPFKAVLGDDLARELTMLGNIIRTESSMEEPVENGEVSDETLIEMRKTFVELLRYAYMQQIEKGEVEVRTGLVAFHLQQSLEYAADAVSDGEAICDWEKLQVLRRPWINRLKEILNLSTKEQMIVAKRQSIMIAKRQHTMMSSWRSTTNSEEKQDGTEATVNEKNTIGVQRAIAFIAAHETAQRTFNEEFCGNHSLSLARNCVLEESQMQVVKAREVILTMDPEKLEKIVSHLLSTILLNNAASYIGKLVAQGLLREQEGEELMHELVEHEFYAIRACVTKKKCLKMEYDENFSGTDV